VVQGRAVKEIVYFPIGIIHTPFKRAKGTPIQPGGARGIRGSVEILPEFVSGLSDLEGFAYIILIYHFHLSRGYSLHVKPFLDDRIRGVFATRAPKRPNALGISVVRLIRIKENILHVSDVDIIDGTPLLDIKPYVPKFDNRRAKRIGWLSETVQKVKNTRADERFE
jgi:tRNA (adenine37-N6)-methyltransferase